MVVCTRMIVYGWREACILKTELDLVNDCCQLRERKELRMNLSFSLDSSLWVSL